MRANQWAKMGFTLVLASSLALAGCGRTANPPTDEPEKDPVELVENSSDPTETTIDLEEADPKSEWHTPAETGDPSIDVPWQTGSSEKPYVPSGDSGLLATDFRVGIHEGYYRVVVEMVGAGDPGWRISWVDESVELGRGEPLPIPQGHVLDILIEGAAWPVSKGAPEYFYNGPADKRLDEDVIAWFDGAFESQTHVAVSLPEEREYRVFSLTDPIRLVVDIKR